MNLHVQLPSRCYVWSRTQCKCIWSSKVQEMPRSRRHQKAQSGRRQWWCCWPLMSQFLSTRTKSSFESFVFSARHTCLAARRQQKSAASCAVFSECCWKWLNSFSFFFSTWACGVSRARSCLRPTRMTRSLRISATHTRSSLCWLPRAIIRRWCYLRTRRLIGPFFSFSFTSSSEFISCSTFS